jgi:hypothetical protein
MSRRTGWLALCAVGLLTAMAAPMEAVTVVPMTFEELVAESVAVVYARVTDVRGQWTQDRRAIDSLIALEPLKYFKGDLGETVIMRLPGGTASGVINVIPGAPSLRSGDLVVLFLTSRGPSIPTTLGLGQGIFRVAHDAAVGGLRVTPPPLKGSVAGRIIRGAADRRTLTLDAFEAAVRDTGAAR